MSPDAGVSDFGFSRIGKDGVGAAGEEREALVLDLDESRQRVRLASAIRRLVQLVVAADLPAELLKDAATQAESLASRLEESAGPLPRIRSHPDPGAPPEEFFPTSPVVGFANPLAPPVAIEIRDEEVHARVSFGEPYEGPPTCVHGGVIAMVFDEMLGAANAVAGQPGMTGTLTIRYRRPTPLGRELRIVARSNGKDGRKIRASAAIYDGDVLTAEAEGLFIEVSPERFAALVEGNVGSDGVARARAEAGAIGLTPVAEDSRRP